MFRVFVIVGLCLSVIVADTDVRRVYPNKHDVKELTEETYDEFIRNNPTSMVLWYNPKCKICKRAKPQYEIAAKYSRIPLARINYMDFKEFANENDVDGYPTVYFYRNGEKTEYHGALTTSAILEYVSRLESQ